MGGRRTWRSAHFFVSRASKRRVLIQCKKRRALPFTLLCRALPHFFVGMGLDGFLLRLSRVFKRGQEDWAVVTTRASVASHKPEQQKHARAIQPRLRLRTAHLRTATIGTAIQTNSTHDGDPLCGFPLTPRRSAPPKRRAKTTSHGYSTAMLGTLATGEIPSSTPIAVTRSSTETRRAHDYKVNGVLISGVAFPHVRI